MKEKIIPPPLRRVQPQISLYSRYPRTEAPIMETFSLETWFLIEWGFSSQPNTRLARAGTYYENAAPDHRKIGFLAIHSGSPRNLWY